MSRVFTFALAAGALLTGVMVAPSVVRASPLTGPGFEPGETLVEKIQDRRCHWVRRRVKTDYGWEWRRVRVCSGGYD